MLEIKQWNLDYSLENENYKKELFDLEKSIKQHKEKSDSFEKMDVKYINNAEFDKYFSNKNFKQWKLGNCYLVSSLRSLMENNNYKKLILNSVGTVYLNWKIKYFVIKLPFWEPNWKPILIWFDDINNKEYIIKNWKKIEKSWISDWPLGIRALEAAYNEYVLWISLWPLTKMESWFGSLAIFNLLWGENVNVFNYKIPYYNPSWELEPYWRKPWEKYKKYFENIEFNDIKTFLLWFNKNDHVVTLSSRIWKSGEKTYMVWWNKFSYNHSYSLVWVSKSWNEIQSVDVINPHDTSKIVSLSYSEFISTFSLISGGILTNNFMDNTTNPYTSIPFDTNIRR